MGLLAYSGITTKVRAMESRLLKPEQFRELAEQRCAERGRLLERTAGLRGSF